MANLFMVAWMLVVPLAAGESAQRNEPAEAAKIRALHEDYAKAWNAHDVEAMAKNWVEDGDYTEPDGRTVFGRAEIAKLLKIEHGSVFKKSRLFLAVERVRMIDEDAAIADGSYELFDAVDPTGKPIGVRAGYFTNILVKDGDGKWSVSSARLMLPQVLIWRER